MEQALKLYFKSCIVIFQVATKAISIAISHFNKITFSMLIKKKINLI